MKGDAFYASTAAVCRDSLVVTGCTCKAGSHGLERGVCVHNIPLILQLVLLLVDGLANHILVVLCHCWSSHLESKIEELGQLEMAKRAILMRMKANGSENTSSLCHLSVNEILSKMYDVGTEKPKSFGFPEPKDEELIPLRLMDITSDNKKAKDKLKRLQFEEEDNTVSSSLTMSIQSSDPPGWEARFSETKQPSSSDSSEVDASEDKETADSCNGEVEGLNESRREAETYIGEEQAAPLLPPGWEARLSETKQLPYYTHPRHKATWYFPGSVAHCNECEQMKKNKDFSCCSSTNDRAAASNLIRLRGGGEGEDNDESISHDDITILRKGKHYNTLETLKCEFCTSSSPMPTNHVCRHQIRDGPCCMIEGTDEKICGKAICVICSEANGITEEERRTRCPFHATRKETRGYSQLNSERASVNTIVDKTVNALVNASPGNVERKKSLNKNNNKKNKDGKENDDYTSIDDLTYTPDYLKVAATIAPLDTLMEYGEEDFDDESKRNIIGLRLLQMRKLEQEKKELLKQKSRNPKQKRIKSYSVLWKKAIEKCSTRTEENNYGNNYGRGSINTENNDCPILLDCNSSANQPTTIPNENSNINTTAQQQSTTTYSSSSTLPHSSSTNHSNQNNKNENTTTAFSSSSSHSTNRTNPTSITISSSSLSSTNQSNPTSATALSFSSLSTNQNNQSSKKTKKRMCHQTCKFHACTNHDGMKNIKLKHVPKPALEKSLPKSTDRREKFKRYYSKYTQHKEFLKAMGLPSHKFDYNNTRICCAHKVIKKEKTMKITRMVSGKMIEQKIKFQYEIPDSSGVKSTLTKNRQSLTRKNTAKERRQVNEWKESL